MVEKKTSSDRSVFTYVRANVITIYFRTSTEKKEMQIYAIATYTRARSSVAYKIRLLVRAVDVKTRTSAASHTRNENSNNSRDSHRATSRDQTGDQPATTCVSAIAVVVVVIAGCRFWVVVRGGDGTTVKRRRVCVCICVAFSLVHMHTPVPRTKTGAKFSTMTLEFSSFFFLLPVRPPNEGLKLKRL